MLNLSTETKHAPAEVLKKALAFFGPGGYGLKVTAQEENYIALEGGGGGVQVSVSAKDKKTAVDIHTREWESQIKDFAASLK